VPFERNGRFIGRETELAQLEGKIFVEDGTTKIAITGLGGVGKTQLLLELVYKTRKKYENCSIIWIAAINMESVQQAYLDVARQLRIPGWEADKVDVKRLVKEYLSKESAGQWLLVFDNADDIDMWIDRTDQESDPLIEYLPRSIQGCIVFTTRDRKAAVKLAHQNIVEVLQMNESAATQLLQRCLVNQDLIKNERDTKALLEQLTCLPLAIVQAAAYINANGITLAKYLSLLEEQEDDVIDLLSEEFEDEGRYRSAKNPIATTWLISFEQIRHRDPLAAEYLSFMACVDAKDIPVSLLPPGPSKKKEADAIGMLDAYSFINKRSEDLSLDLHRLVHLATRNWLRKEDLLAKWTERAVARLKDVLPVDFHQADQCRSVWRRYLTHARYTLECNTIEKDDECKFELAWRLATCLHCDGRYAEAEVLYAESVESEKKMLGPEHKHTLASMGALALIISDRGRWKEAEELQTQVVEAEKRVLGPEHPNTLTNMSNLALTFWRQGRLEEAEKLGMQVLEINKRILGLEHPDTLSSMNSLAVTFSDQGRMKEAEDLYTQVIEIRKSVLGQEHIDALISMSNLALTFRRQRRLKEAEELGLQVLEISKRVLGREHPSTLTSMNNLAFTWNSCGRRTEALKLMEECVLLRSQALGPNHPHTLDSRELLLEWQTEELGTAASVDEDVDV
jgi:tetratricopeptide (TPR) repeat protein